MKKAHRVGQGQRVVVTGGANGIGRATAQRFAEAGARVVILDLDESATEATVEDLPVLAGSVRADVSNAKQVKRAFRKVDDLLGGLDVLVSNAGISERRRFLDMDESSWRRVVGVNLDGMFYCLQEAAIRMMAEDGGVLLMTASTNGIVGHPLYSSYNASKAGVILLARTLALELAPKIRVNAVCPGYVMTAMQKSEYTPDMIADVNRTIPLGRHATPEEVADLFVFLASDSAKYITGQAIGIDGGELAGGTASMRALLAKEATDG